MSGLHETTIDHLEGLVGPKPEIGRDRYGRPLVTPPDGGKRTAYTRCTTFVGVLEDTYNLSRWQMRMVAIGLSDRPDLALAVAAARDDKDRLNRVCEDAVEAAKGHAAATTGTALHSLTELVDRGQPLPVLPPGAAADMAAYQTATAALTPVAIEQFLVLDDLKIGGTPDRIVEYDGGRYIADLKTGNIEFGRLKIAQQLAVYSRSLAYDIPTGRRTPTGVDQDLGIVIHLPAGTGTCTLHWVDIAKGWEAVQTSAVVREWRKLDRPKSDLIVAMDVLESDDPGDEWEAQPLGNPQEAAWYRELEAEIRAAPTIADLEDIWAVNQWAWTDDLTKLASARKQELTAAGQAA